MVRLTDRPDITLDVYRGRKTTTQQIFAKSHYSVKSGVRNPTVNLTSCKGLKKASRCTKSVSNR